MDNTTANNKHSISYLLTVIVSIILRYVMMIASIMKISSLFGGELRHTVLAFIFVYMIHLIILFFAVGYLSKIDIGKIKTLGEDDLRELRYATALPLMIMWFAAYFLITILS